MTIQGYGKLEKGNVHAIVEGQTLCSKKEIDIDPELNIMSVNCKKCMRLKLFRDTLAQLVNDPPDEIKVDDSDLENLDFSNILEIVNRNEIINPIEEKPILEEKPKKSNYQKIEIIIPDDPESSPLIHCPITIEDEVYLKKDKATINDELAFSRIIEKIPGQFIARIDSNLKYNIYHYLGDVLFFAGVEKDKVASCLISLNSIDEKWSGRGSTSAPWLDKIRSAMALGYLIATAEKPIEKIQEKPKNIDKNISEKNEMPVTDENNNKKLLKIKIREDIKTLILQKKKPILKVRMDLKEKILNRRK